MSGILFNYIPGNGLVAPGRFFEANSGGQYQPSGRFILVGFKTSAGSMALNTPIPVASQNMVDAFAGAGSMLREMYRITQQQNTAGLPIYIMAIDDSALTARVGTITIGSGLAAGVGAFEFCGELIQIPVGSADTPTTIAAAVAAALNSYYNPLTGAMLPVTATSSAGVVTWTARNKGAWASEIDIWVNPKILGNVFAISGVWTAATTTAGAGTPTGVAAALAVLGDTQADFIVCPFADTTSLGSAYAALNDISGRWSWSRQSYGHYWCAGVGNYSALTSLTFNNDRHSTFFGCFSPGANGTPHGSWLWIAAAAAAVAQRLLDVTTGNVSGAQAGTVLVGVRPPRDQSLWPNYTARNTLLQLGVSTWSVNSAGQVMIDKLITTYLTGSGGQSDAVFRDVQAVYQASGGLKFMRADMDANFAQRALAPTNPGNLGVIVTPADIKSQFISSYTQLTKQGVFSDAATFASLLVVQINATNPDRADVYAPLERVNPFDILAANATFYQQYPQAA
jgi:phage tail sheath gpL-like